MHHQPDGGGRQPRARHRDVETNDRTRLLQAIADRMSECPEILGVAKTGILHQGIVTLHASTQKLRQQLIQVQMVGAEGGGELDERDSRLTRDAVQLDLHPGNDAERATRTDEQLFQVDPGVVFPQPRQIRQDCCIALARTTSRPSRLRWTSP